MPASSSFRNCGLCSHRFRWQLHWSYLWCYFRNWEHLDGQKDAHIDDFPGSGFTGAIEGGYLCAVEILEQNSLIGKLGTHLSWSSEICLFSRSQFCEQVSENRITSCKSRVPYEMSRSIKAPSHLISQYGTVNNFRFHPLVIYETGNRPDTPDHF